MRRVMSMSAKITNLQQLETIRHQLAERISLRREEQIRPLSVKDKIVFLVCTGGGCLASGAIELACSLRSAITMENLSGQAEVVETGCMGPCSRGPVIKVLPSGIYYSGNDIKDPNEFVRQINQGLRDGQLKINKEELRERNFFKGQKKIALRNCGCINHSSITEYIGADGYFGLAKCLLDMCDVEIINEISLSGLRGRGGGGFPTGKKWEFAKNSLSESKIVVCNADEGDPGAFMDRSILEGDPHSLIEGMAIAGRAIGAHKGYVYVRAEYPLAVERLSNAIQDATSYGLLGENILGSGFSFDLEIRMGSGAFVCGEETALLNSIEGKRGEPRPRPPFPAVKGLWGYPTLLNNVETLAVVPAIIFNGAKWYATYGTEKSKGTKVFALAGAVANTGLVEVPIGISLGELVYDIGGGIKDTRQFKAAQIGGPSGGCIPREHLQVPLDYESLSKLGAIMGSGGLIVMDDESCMVDVARFFLEFVQEESCGKCTPCRVGTKRLLEILERICAGDGREGDINALIELGEEIKETALCGLGKTAANPVLSTIRHFYSEYVAHIRDHHCPAGVCAGLVRASCQSACPANIDIPGFVSLIGDKRYADALKLHRERNPFAAACARVCFHTCEEHCRRSSLDDAVAIRGVKRFMVDQEVTVQVPEVRENEENARRKIAIIGAGPAGLSCAYFLARLGYRPRVFEKGNRPGGMMVQAIPAYRLPREILAREIRMIERLGVDIRTEYALGEHFSLSSLKAEGYEAVFLAVGAPNGVKLGIQGEDTNGVEDSLSFLRQYNTRGSVAVGKNVVVCGGGNSAIDAARTALRLGAETVTIVYRRTREEMPAYAEEILEAEKEGVQFLMLTNPESIKQENNHVCALVCKRMQLGEFDKSGRRRAVEKEGQVFELKTDQVIVAIGQRIDVRAMSNGTAVEMSSRGYIKADPVNGQTSVSWLFSGGDAVDGPSSVVEAVAGGERAAVGIDKFLTGESHAFWRKEHENKTAFDPEADPSSEARAEQPLIGLERRRNNFDEVEMSWTEPVAVSQAKRCLRCDYGKKLCKCD